MVTACLKELGQGSARKSVLLVSGHAIFDHAEEMEHAFFRALHGCDHLVVNIARIEQVDLSFVMLLCATHRTAELLKKRLTIQGALPDDSKRHFEHARRSRTRGCLFSGRSSCIFWEQLAEPAVAA